MQMLFLQTAGLLLAAYFVGAFCGCLTRRVFFAGRAPEVVEPAVVAPLVEPPPIPQTTRFEEALKGPGTVPAAPVEMPKPVPMPFDGRLPAAGGSSGQGSVAAMVSVAHVDDLTLIRGIDASMKERLAGLGISKFADIAGWRASDVARVSASLGIKGRIAAENWIEQAQVLAKGGSTRYAQEKLAGVVLARPTEDEGTPKTVEPLPVPRVEERAAFAEVAKPAAAAEPAPAPAPVPAPSPTPSAQPSSAAATAAIVAEAAAAVSRLAQAAAAERAAAPGPRDDLKRIAGITADVEQSLNANGVTRFEQIAGWSSDAIQRFDRLVGGTGRIAAENWVEQAQILARGGETAYSRERDRQADTVRPVRVIDPVSEDVARLVTNGRGEGAGDRSSDLGAMRSVRSEAYRGDAGPHRTDDLKRIRGIGLLIERRLSALGVTTYDQIANWSDSDIARISQSLEFKGRIERENWVEQARILASGGQTEFSRRVDRGDAETSRSRAE